jgi:hypothetical protein
MCRGLGRRNVPAGHSNNASAGEFYGADFMSIDEQRRMQQNLDQQIICMCRGLGRRNVPAGHSDASAGEFYGADFMSIDEQRRMQQNLDQQFNRLLACVEGLADEMCRVHCTSRAFKGAKLPVAGTCVTAIAGTTCVARLATAA